MFRLTFYDEYLCANLLQNSMDSVISSCVRDEVDDVLDHSISSLDICIRKTVEVLRGFYTWLLSSTV